MVALRLQYKRILADWNEVGRRCVVSPECCQTYFPFRCGLHEVQLPEFFYATWRNLDPACVFPPANPCSVHTPIKNDTTYSLRHRPDLSTPDNAVYFLIPMNSIGAPSALCDAINGPCIAAWVTAMGGGDVIGQFVGTTVCDFNELQTPNVCPMRLVTDRYLFLRMDVHCGTGQFSNELLFDLTGLMPGTFTQTLRPGAPEACNPPFVPTCRIGIQPLHVINLFPPSICFGDGLAQFAALFDTPSIGPPWDLTGSTTNCMGSATTTPTVELTD